jgi:hypothetical protein
MERRKEEGKAALHARESGMEKLVKHPQEWPWSSFSFYAHDEAGLIGTDPVD